jgi:hypothetical protein
MPRDPARNRRDYYRVVYPRELRPVFVGADGRWPVIDLSERGMRLLARGDAILPRTPIEETLGDDEDPPEPPRVEGTIRFPDGRDSQTVAGVAIYRAGTSVGVAFDADGGVPMPRIIAEQRILIKLGFLKREDPNELAALRAELGLKDP